MYYIKPEKGGCVSFVCKRLRDFRGKEGSRHHVRKRKNIEMLDYIPIYEVADKALHLLKQLEFWQNLLEDWPADAEHIVLESPVDAKHIVLESKEDADENN